MQFGFLIILLVISIYDIAHGETFPLNKKDLVTSLLSNGDAAAEQGKNLLNPDNKIVAVRTPSSAVQDWSLVCQQLCGAALGGVECAPYCKNLPILPYHVQLKNAEELLDLKNNYICPELCGLQLGDSVCTCKNYVTKNLSAHMKAKENTNVCAVLCDHNSVTLTGCTPCTKGEKNNSKYRVFESINPFDEEVESVTTTSTTTPDWNQLCATLCKTGDGGSLCNCDLSPFTSYIFKDI